MTGAGVDSSRLSGTMEILKADPTVRLLCGCHQLAIELLIVLVPHSQCWAAVLYDFKFVMGRGGCDWWCHEYVYIVNLKSKPKTAVFALSMVVWNNSQFESLEIRMNLISWPDRWTRVVLYCLVDIVVQHRCSSASLYADIMFYFPFCESLQCRLCLC